MNDAFRGRSRRPARMCWSSIAVRPLGDIGSAGSSSFLPAPSAWSRSEARSSMRIAEVVGTVTLNRWHPAFAGARLRLVVPLSLSNLRDDQPPAADELVAWDELGAGLGARIAMSEGAEAAQ